MAGAFGSEIDLGAQLHETRLQDAIRAQHVSVVGTNVWLVRAAKPQKLGESHVDLGDAVAERLCLITSAGTAVAVHLVV